MQTCRMAVEREKLYIGVPRRKECSIVQSCLSASSKPLGTTSLSYHIMYVNWVYASISMEIVIPVQRFSFFFRFNSREEIGS